MAIFCAIAGRMLRSKRSQSSSLLLHSSNGTPASIWESSSPQRLTSFSGSYREITPLDCKAGGAAEDQSRRSESIPGNQQALHFGNCRARSATLTNLLSNKVQSAVCSAQVGEHESREVNSDQLTSFTPGKGSQCASSMFVANCKKLYSPEVAQRLFHSGPSTAHVGRSTRTQDREVKPRFKEEILSEQPSRRPVEGPLSWEAPIKLIYEMLQKKGFIDEKTHPLPIDHVASQDDYRIISWYRSIAIGLLKYYQFCDNLSKVRSIVNYLLRWSAIYTLAKKHKSSSSQIIEKYTKSLVISKDGQELASYLSPEEISQYKKKFLMGLDPTPPEVLIDMLFARLVRKKVLEEKCAVKGCEARDVEMHHIRQIEKAGGKHKVRSARELEMLERIKAVQAALNKKHIPLCARHHDELHRGRVFISDLDMNIVI